MAWYDISYLSLTICHTSVTQFCSCDSESINCFLPCLLLQTVKVHICLFLNIFWHFQQLMPIYNTTIHTNIIQCLNHIDKLQLYFYFTHYCPFPFFLFMCLSLLKVLFLFLGASIVCVKEDSRFNLVIPWHDICLYTPLARRLYNLIVLRLKLRFSIV